MSSLVLYNHNRIVLSEKSPTEILGPDEDIKYELARRSFKEFIKLVFPEYVFNWHHDIIVETLEEFYDADSGLDRLIIQAPPRSGKSELAKLFTAWVLGRNPDDRFVYTSYGADLAQKANRDVQKYIDNPIYSKIFPETRLNSANVKTSSRGKFIRTSNEFEVVDHKGGMKTVGVGGALTGSGADFGVCDDLLKDWVEATSAVRKQMIQDWYESTFYSRLSKKGKVLIIMTRWAEDDLPGRLLKKMKKDPNAEKYEVISFPMLFEESEYNHPEDYRDLDEPLWPEFFPFGRCAQIRNDSGSRIWGSLYQQRPAPEHGNLVNRNWWRFYSLDPNDLDFDYYSLSCDFTFKDGRKSDYVVIQVWAKKGARYYLLDQTRDKMNFTATVHAVKAMCAKWPDYREVLVEEKANGAAVIDTLKEEISGIVAYNPTESKDARAASITGLIEAGNVYLPDPLIAFWVKDYIEEWALYPNGSNDDQIDATSQILKRMRKAFGWLDKFNEDDDHVKERPLSKEEQIMELLAQSKGRGGSALDF